MSELRSLERKHGVSIDQSLKHLKRLQSEDGGKAKGLISKLMNLEKRIKRSPMTKVYHACLKRDALEVPVPPCCHHIQILELLGRVYAEAADNRNDTNDSKAKETFHQALELADATESTRSGARLRLYLCSVLTKWTNAPESVKAGAILYLDQVIDLVSSMPDLAKQALEMKEALKDRKKEIAEVLKAMNIVDGYDYGGSWSAHWYECPNGHPYFIGDCGGAMQESRCIECHAPIGGHSHMLNSTNRSAGGLVRDAMQSI
jgi:hypothetical protein